MGIGEFFLILQGIMKFWDETVWLIKTLQGTPEEHKEKIMAALKSEAENFSKTGRPTWN